MFEEIENVFIEVSTFLRIQSNMLCLIVSNLMSQFVLECMLFRKYKEFFCLIESQKFGLSAL